MTHAHDHHQRGSHRHSWVDRAESSRSPSWYVPFRVSYTSDMTDVLLFYSGRERCGPQRSHHLQHHKLYGQDRLDIITRPRYEYKDGRMPSYGTYSSDYDISQPASPVICWQLGQYGPPRRGLFRRPFVRGHTRSRLLCRTP